MTPEQIMENAKCFQCIPVGMQSAVLIALSQEDFMHTFATVTPVDYNIVDAFGYTTNARNFPGLLSIRFLPSSTIAGYSITAQASLLSIEFPNLTSFPTGALFNFNGNTVLTNLSFPALVTCGPQMAISSAVSPLPALTSLYFPNLTTLTAGFVLSTAAALPTVSIPLLTSSGATMQIATCASLTLINLPSLLTCTNLTMNANTALTNIVLTSLTTATGTINFSGATALPSVSFPALVSAGAFNGSGCTALTSLSFPNYLPTNGSAINFGTCALDQASVDHVLARAVANAAYVSGTITLNGGTNATPSAAGLADKATLIGRGCTVNTN